MEDKMNKVKEHIIFLNNKIEEMQNENEDWSWYDLAETLEKKYKDELGEVIQRLIEVNPNYLKDIFNYMDRIF
jgi:hypothetical protein